MSTHRLRGSVPVALFALALPLGALGIVTWNSLFREEPSRLSSAEELFKYGSLGNTETQGIPFYVWMVLPRIFPQYLPGNGGYASFGFVSEPGHEVPIGFAKHTVGFPRVTFNCALCHTATYRLAPQDPPVIVPAGPSHQADTQAYLDFLFACASDPRFNADILLSEIARNVELSAVDELLYRYALIPATKRALLEQREQARWMKSKPKWGPGRIDPFNPVKFGLLQMEPDATIGNADNMAIWHLSSRTGQRYHWDGMNDSLREVVLSSAFGDGADPQHIAFDALLKIEDWLVHLPPPKYPGAIDHERARAGSAIFQRLCHDCHGTGGTRTGRVVSVEEVGTDGSRHGLWPDEAARRYGDYTEGYSYQFTHFSGTDQPGGGYVALPLDGIWLRAPYLHNGSVPSLRDLLSEPYAGDAPEQLSKLPGALASLSRRELRTRTDAVRLVGALVQEARANGRRPPVFFRGHDVIDTANVGFVSDVGTLGEAPFPFLYDTRVTGNGAAGHRGERYGTTLAPEEKLALIEYLKTL